MCGTKILAEKNTHVPVLPQILVLSENDITKPLNRLILDIFYHFKHLLLYGSAKYFSDENLYAKHGVIRDGFVISTSILRMNDIDNHVHTWSYGGV